MIGIFIKKGDLDTERDTHREKEVKTQEESSHVTMVRHLQAQDW